jgi:hypothetical protein
METHRCTELTQKIDFLSNEWARLDARELEDEIFDIILELLKESLSLQNPTITQLSSYPDGLYRIGGDIGLRIIRSRVDNQSIDRVISRAIGSNYLEQPIAFSIAGFTDEAIQITSRVEPVHVELIDFPRLKAWVAGSSEQAEKELTSVQLVVRDFSRRIVELVANDPSKLDPLEWRDVERMLAEACSGLGFQVQLTPPAKDGGKDLVLRCWIFGYQRTYYVEIKHWSTRVRHNAVRDFLKVVIEDQVDNGLILATTGYTENAFKELTRIERFRVSGAGREKTVALCQMYVRAKSGLIVPSAELPELLFDDTLPDHTTSYTF